MEISRNGSRSARRFPRWIWWSLLSGVLLLIVGFVSFLPTIGHGGGGLQIVAMALGVLLIGLALAALIIAFISRRVKTYR